ncbi:MAG TPA: hypothetical protein VKQ70_17015 [Caulobacteraceae bacterium]|jgi:hypothetical protein|nr:hypothetical protein [Caulobacteraceae bacterium]
MSLSDDDPVGRFADIRLDVSRRYLRGLMRWTWQLTFLGAVFIGVAGAVVRVAPGIVQLNEVQVSGVAVFAAAGVSVAGAWMYYRTLTVQELTNSLRRALSGRQKLLSDWDIVNDETHVLALQTQADDYDRMTFVAREADSANEVWRAAEALWSALPNSVKRRSGR